MSIFDRSELSSNPAPMSENSRIVPDKNQIAIVGHLTVSQVGSLFRTPITFQTPQCDICLKQVDGVDSAGLALLVYWVQVAKEAGSVVRFKNVPQKISALVSICNLEAIFHGE